MQYVLTAGATAVPAGTPITFWAYEHLATSTTLTPLAVADAGSTSPVGAPEAGTEHNWSLTTTAVTPPNTSTPLFTITSDSDSWITKVTTNSCAGTTTTCWRGDPAATSYSNDCTFSS